MAVTDYNDGFNNGLAVGINIKGAEGAGTGTGSTIFGIKKLSMKYFPPVKRTRSRSGSTITKI